MKRKALEKQLAKNAKEAGTTWEFVREGANHSKTNDEEDKS